MSGASFAAALIPAFGPAVAVAGVTLALNEVRIYREDERLKASARAVEEEIDRLITELDGE
jgi:hypothetical protein